MDEIVKKKMDFVDKASHCDYNRLWKCMHKEQKGKKCDEICKHYKNSYEQEEIEIIKN
jgi:hypothetical protein